MQSKSNSTYTIPQGCSDTFLDRFFSRIIKTINCWIWTGYIDNVGYGAIGKGRKGTSILRAHRASWIIHNGNIPKGMYVLHDCPGGDNKLCVNPDHLKLGTNAENGYDRRIKQQAPSGESCIASKLTWDEVCEIRRNPISQTEAARLFNIHQSEISRIRHYKRWLRKC